MDDLISKYMSEHPTSRIVYQSVLGSDYNAYIRFRQFYHALMSVPFTYYDHYTTITYTDNHDIVGTFRLMKDSLYKKEQNVVICDVHSKNRSYKVEVIATESIRNEPFDITRTGFDLKRTELAEIWEFTVFDVLYTMEKRSTGVTKQCASQTDPVYHIKIKHGNVNNIYDLFGKYDDTPIGALEVIKFV